MVARKETSALKEILDYFPNDKKNVVQKRITASDLFKMNNHRWLEGTLDSDVWVIENSNYKKLGNTLDFNEFKTFNKNLPYTFIDEVKYWMVDNITRYSIPSTQLSNLKIVFQLTHGFQVSKLDDLINFLEFSELSIDSKQDYILSVKNFLSFCNLEQSKIYIQQLSEMSRKLGHTQSTTNIPSTKSLITFSNYLDYFFTEAEKDKDSPKGQARYYFYYSLKIWWELTTIIPMRPVEFCLTERNCLPIRNGKYPLKIKRRKENLQKKNNKNIQIPDTLYINKELHEFIKNYISTTEQFGESETLISYYSYKNYYKSSHKKKNEMVFNIYNLDYLLDRFYLDLEKEFNIVVEPGQMVRPNSTRHVAIVNMMMQGYNAVEIARLAGHSTLYTQFDYYNHTEMWRDSEVFKAVLSLKKNKTFSIETQVIPSKISLKVLGCEEFPEESKLKIGYCKDYPNYRCESQSHFLCKYWGCNQDEFNNKKSIILSEVYKKEEIVDGLVSTLTNLNKQFISDKSLHTNSEYYNHLKNKSFELQGEINDLGKLKSIIIENEALKNEQ